MGRPWATPLIQLTGTSDDAIDTNVYGHLKPMLRYGPLADRSRWARSSPASRMTARSRPSRRRPCRDWATRSSSPCRTRRALHRLKQAPQGRRDAAPWRGRHGWSLDRDYEHLGSVRGLGCAAHVGVQAPDIFRFWRNPDTRARRCVTSDGTAYKFTVARERRKILQFVYAGSPHVDLDGIEAEALELMEKDPGQAERFYGNRVVAGLASGLPRERVGQPREAARVDVPDGTVVVGFDGSDIDDWTGFRCETRDGYQFTPTFPDGRPMIWNPADHLGDQVPRLEVAAGLATSSTPTSGARVRRSALLDDRDRLLGREVRREGHLVGTPTAISRCTLRLSLHVDRRAKQDSGFTHDGCPTTRQHMGTPRPKAHRLNRAATCSPSPAMAERSTWRSRPSWPTRLTAT